MENSDITQQKKEKKKFELKQTPHAYIESFLTSYFKETHSIIAFEKDFFNTNRLLTTKIDYSKLKRFVVTAIRRFQELDQKFLTGLLLKLYRDVESLFDYAHELKTKTAMPELVFSSDFLRSIDEYRETQDQIKEIEHRKSKFEQECNQIEKKLKTLEKQLYIPEVKAEYKDLKLKLGAMAHYFGTAKTEYDDAYEKMSYIKNLTHGLFLKTFKDHSNACITELLAYANNKAFYLDKVLWSKAQESPTIKLFLATARIEGDYDTKTFLKYYLKNINPESAADKDWHSYLVQVMKML